MHGGLAEGELTGNTVFQNCKHICFALVRLLMPCAGILAIQALHVLAMVSISLLQSVQADYGSIQEACSAQYYLLEGGTCKGLYL